jgi:hypothetical protein
MLGHRRDPSTPSPPQEIARPDRAIPRRQASGASSVSVERAQFIFSRYFKIFEAMPKAVVDLSEHANRIVNVVKARDGLRGKNEAIEAIVAAYEERILDPALQPEFVESLQRVRRGPFRKIRSPAELLEAPK